MQIFKRLYYWYLRKYAMCKCSIPEYEAIDKILKCAICKKPAKWEGIQR